MYCVVSSLFVSVQLYVFHKSQLYFLNKIPLRNRHLQFLFITSRYKTVPSDFGTGFLYRSDGYRVSVVQETI